MPSSPGNAMKVDKCCRGCSRDGRRASVPRTSPRPPGVAARDRSPSWMAKQSAVALYTTRWLARWRTAAALPREHFPSSQAAARHWIAHRCDICRQECAAQLCLPFICGESSSPALQVVLPWNRGTRSGSGVSLETRIRLVSSTPSSTARSVVRCTILFWELWGRDPCGRSGAAVKFPKPRVRKKRKTGRFFFFFFPSIAAASQVPEAD